MLRWSSMSWGPGMLWVRTRTACVDEGRLRAKEVSVAWTTSGGALTFTRAMLKSTSFEPGSRSPFMAKISSCPVFGIGNMFVNEMTLWEKRKGARKHTRSPSAQLCNLRHWLKNNCRNYSFTSTLTIRRIESDKI